MANAPQNPPPWRRAQLSRASAGVALLCFTGCGKLDRVEECNTLAAVVNPRLDAIEAAVKVPSAKAYREAAKLYGAAAEELRKLPLPSSVGQQLSHEYVAMLTELRPVLEAYANALEKNDAAQKESNARYLERMKRVEGPLLARLAAYCGGR